VKKVEGNKTIRLGMIMKYYYTDTNVRLEKTIYWPKFVTGR
jgi:hypothetical protein